MTGDIGNKQTKPLLEEVDQEDLLTGKEGLEAIGADRHTGVIDISPYNLAIYLATKRLDSAKEMVAKLDDYVFSRYLSMIKEYRPELLTYKVISNSNVSGTFSFNEVSNKEKLIEYLEKAYKKHISPHIVRAFFNSASEEQVKLDHTSWSEWAQQVMPGAPEPLLAFLALYASSRFASRSTKAKIDYLEVFGLKEQESGTGDETTVSVMTEAGSSLPGFSMRLDFTMQKREDEYDPSMGVASFPGFLFLPDVVKIPFSSFFYLSLLDYFFGYRWSSRTSSGQSLASEFLEPEDVARYLELRAGLDEILVKNLRFSELGLKEHLPIYRQLSAVQRSELAKLYAQAFSPINDFLNEVFVISSLKSRLSKFSSYGEGWAKVDDIDWIVSSLFLALASKQVPSKRKGFDGGKTVFDEIFGGKDKVSISEVVLLTIPSISGFIERYFISRGERLFSDIAVYLNRNHRSEEAKRLAKHFNAVLRRTGTYLLKHPKVRSFAITYVPEGTAYASLRARRDGKLEARVNINLPYMIYNAITTGVNWVSLVIGILYHELLHFYYRHVSPFLKKDKITSSFSVQDFVEPERLSKVHKDLSSLIPKSISNIHEDAFINNNVLKFASYIAPSRSSLDYYRLRNLFDSRFYIGDEARPTPNTIYLTDYSKVRVAGQIVGPSDPSYASKLAGRLHKVSFILPNLIINGAEVDGGDEKHNFRDFFKEHGSSRFEVASLSSLLALIAILSYEALSARSGGQT